MHARLASLHIYPVKSCRGIAMQAAKVAATGLEYDRHWLLINAHGRFVTQREQPCLALIGTELIHAEGNDVTLRLTAPGMETLDVVRKEHYGELQVSIWRDTLLAQDEGDVIAAWFSTFLNSKVRLARFHPDVRRRSSVDWTGDVVALNQFADGFAMLAISEASLADLNSRLSQPLPMNRFRPNLVLADLDPYDEDRAHELRHDQVQLRIVKPCTRCKITTTDQATGEVQGDEPLTTLKSYRWSDQLNGVAFGQNVIVMAGAGQTIAVGQRFEVSSR